jgi:hypothetical protein
MLQSLNHFSISKQVQLLATMSYWAAIETSGNDRTPNSISGGLS